MPSKLAIRPSWWDSSIPETSICCWIKWCPWIIIENWIQCDGTISCVFTNLKTVRFRRVNNRRNSFSGVGGNGDKKMFVEGSSWGWTGQSRQKVSRSSRGRINSCHGSETAGHEMYRLIECHIQSELDSIQTPRKNWPVVSDLFCLCCVQHKNWPSFWSQ